MRGLLSPLARRRRRSERGAVLVEVVLILPVLLVITLGVFDVGLGWRTSLTITNAARSGARVGSNLGQDSSADQSALAAVSASLGTIPSSEIDVVVIYKATSAAGTVPSGCLDSTTRTAGGSAALSCNVYSAADLAAAATSTAYNGNCSTSRDRFWCPSTRQNQQASANGPDFLGVYVRINHATKTKLFGSTMVMKDQAVMRIEPNAGD
ncbi:MAG: TadE/TadG family type IV pilus assembly protein [Acidimicrobiales bacterium]